MENTEHTPQDLNDNELKALKAFAESNEDNGRDFGFFDEACGYVDGLTVEQMKGYASALQTKGLVVCYEYDNGDETSQAVDLTAEGWAIIDRPTDKVELPTHTRPEYEACTKELSFEITVANQYDFETRKYGTFFSFTLDVMIPETLNERQERKIMHCLSAWANQHFWTEGTKEFKRIQVNKFPGSPLVFLQAEVGLINDEGTVASIICRDHHFVRIGKRGGLDAMNKNGTWIDGMHAIHTQSGY